MKSEYVPTIGLEVHAELKTKTKMFCSCLNDPDEERPNINICPICLGHPGTLPVINKEAVKNVLKMGVAVGGKLANKSEFDRKNYFYPDIPKGYQISQYKYPLVSYGKIAGVELTRIHLEEDTASSSHTKGDYSLVNFNRAGVPLLELVTEPVIHKAEEVSKFGEELQLLLQYLGVSDANMEKGEMRLEANISVKRSDIKKDKKGLSLGTKVEIKNLNSFKSAERAVLFEITRHIEVLESGGQVIQETRGWDENKQETFSQRLKEDSHDYRYFPDPDLPKLVIAEVEDFRVENIKKFLSETPEERRERIKKDYRIKTEDVEFYIKNREYFGLFENTAKFLNEASFQLLSNYIVSDISGKGGNDANPKDLAELILMIQKGEISSRGAKIIIPKMLDEKLDPRQIAIRDALIQQNNIEEIEELADQIIKENDSIVKEYKNGKMSSIQYLIGQAMKKTKGSVNPSIIKDIIQKKLKI